jgi:peptide/nickel transport system permease protein
LNAHWPRFLTVYFRSPLGAFSAVCLLALIGLAIFAPIVLQAAASRVDVLSGSQTPSPQHLLGTDALGRDVLARTLVATRLSLELALSATLVAASIGLPIGAAIGMFPPRARAAAMRVIDALLSFPDILIAIIAVAILGAGAIGAALGVGLSAVPWFARLSATLAFSIVGRDYVIAARTLGVGRLQLLLRYILANMSEQLVVAIALILGYSLIAVSSLSFLGIGVQPPDYDWGRLLTQGVQSIYETPLAALAPALMIGATGMVFGLAGDALAAALNPILWTTGPRRLWPGVFGLLPRSRSELTSVAGSPMRLPAADVLLQIDGLTITNTSERQPVDLVHDVSLTMKPGEIVGVVGESGSGKTLTTLAIAGLLPPNLTPHARSMSLRGENLLGRSSRDGRRFKDGRVAVIFQDPLSSLNPAMRIGAQMTEAVRTHLGMPGRQADALAITKLQEVLVSAPAARLRQYPHQLSGGIRQRVMIAMGLMTEPDLIVADEPTTSLDVTVQAEVIEVLREANRRNQTAIILVSHNLAVVAEICSRVVVMYGGRIVEDAPTRTLLSQPLHPYTRALVAAVPQIAGTLQLKAIPGSPPDPRAMPAGCPFAPRCPLKIVRCSVEMPALVTRGDGRRVACWVTAADAASEQVPA